MRRLQRGQNSFGLAQELKTLDAFFVRRRNIGGPTGILVERMLRPNPGIIQARRDGMCADDLAMSVLQEIAQGSVENSFLAARQWGGMVSRGQTFTRRFHANHL